MIGRIARYNEVDLSTTAFSRALAEEIALWKRADWPVSELKRICNSHSRLQPFIQILRIPDLS